MIDATPTAEMWKIAQEIHHQFMPCLCPGDADCNGAKTVAWAIAAHAAQAVKEAEFNLLQEVNRVFCGGLSSSLGLEFMRDMSVRLHTAQAVAEERERCAAVIDGANFLDQVEKEWLAVHLRAGQQGSAAPRPEGA